MATIIQLRRDTAANWTSVDPTLASGEMGIETDTLLIKIGDGVTEWTSLPYYTTSGVGYETISEEGTPLTQRDTLNFVGSGITAVDDGANTRTNVSLDATLEALAGYNTNGLITQTAADTFTGRTITGTADKITVTNGDGVSGNPTLTVASTYAGQNTITTVGTIGTGTWQGTTVASGYGGTGFTTYAAGDIIYASGVNTLAKLTAGTDGQVLTLASGVPTWAAPTGGFTNPMTTEGDIIYGDTGGTALRLGIGGEGEVLSVASGVPAWTAVGGTGTVTSINLTAGTGISVSGGPITTSGSITVNNTDAGSAQNIFKTISVSGQSDVVADSNNDTLTLVAGTNVTITTDATTDSITINSTGGGSSDFIGFKNKIIGGDFTLNPWQRGTSFTAPSTGTYTADRWGVSYITSAVVNVLKTADSPTVVQAGIYTQHCLHIDVTTADATIAAGDVFHLTQRIEGLNSVSFGFGQAGTRDVTLSFWHKHTKTGTYCVSLTNSVGNRSYVAEYTQSTTDTWEKAEITIPVDTSGTWLYDTGIGVQVRFSLAAGTTFQTTADTWQAGNFFATSNQVNSLDNTANNFKIALVQLEAGATATGFDVISVGQVLDLCYRYYYRLTLNNLGAFGPSYHTTTTAAQSTFYSPVKMRIAPTSLDSTGTAADYGLYYLTTSAACNTPPTISSRCTEYSLVANFSVAAGLTAGQAGQSLARANGSYLGFSSEL